MKILSNINNLGMLIALLAGCIAQGALPSPELLGLTTETGYLQTREDTQNCDQKTDILLTKASYNHLEGRFDFMTKCDSSIIGWVERIADGHDLEIYPSTSPRQARIMLFTGLDSQGEPKYINIETCGSSRRHELAKDPRDWASRDLFSDYEKLEYIERHRPKFKIQLFYNEYVMSGKCIGSIEILN